MGKIATSFSRRDALGKLVEERMEKQLALAKLK
jgi:hypothetical protein